MSNNSEEKIIVVPSSSSSDQEIFLQNKSPTEVVYYQFSMADLLNDTETITEVDEQSMDAAVIVDQITFSGKIFKARISGGNVNTQISIHFLVTTSLDNIKEVNVILPIVSTDIIEGNDVGSHIYNGKVSPVVRDQYKTGDLYLNTTSNDLYTFNQNQWVKISNLQGAQGERGSLWFFGEKDPVISEYFKGRDCYVNTTTNQLFVYNGSNWEKSLSLEGGKGDQGLKGDKGDQGIQGNKGKDGTYITISSDNPTVSDAKADLIWLNEVSGSLYESILGDNGAYHWKQTGNLKGQAGSHIYNGKVSPVVRDQYKTGDLYLNTTSNDLYTFNQNQWVKISNLQGAQGERGSLWFFGEKDPVISEYFKGRDCYVNTTTNQLFVYNGSNWEKSLSLEGNHGAQGPQGNAGTIEIGNVSTGDIPSITNRGTKTAALLDFILPKGERGVAGDKGDKGDIGPQGVKGDTGSEGKAGVSYINDGTVDLYVKSILSDNKNIQSDGNGNLSTISIASEYLQTSDYKEIDTSVWGDDNIGSISYNVSDKTPVWWNGNGWSKAVIDNQRTPILVATEVKLYRLEFIDSWNTYINFPNMWGSQYGGRTLNNGITIKYFEKTRTADERKAIETEIANEITNPAEKAAKLEEISKKTYSDSNSSGYFPNYNMIQFYNRNTYKNLNNFYFDGPIITTGSLNLGKVSALTKDSILQEGAIALDNNNKLVIYDQANQQWNNISSDFSQSFIELETYDGTTPNRQMIALNPETKNPAIYNEADKKWYDIVINSYSDNAPAVSTKIFNARLAYIDQLILAGSSSYIRFPLNRGGADNNKFPDVNLDFRFYKDNASFVISDARQYKEYFGKAVKYKIEGALQSDTLTLQDKSEITDTSGLKVGEQAYDIANKTPVWWNGNGWSKAVIDNQRTPISVATEVKLYRLEFTDSWNTYINFPNMWGSQYGGRTLNNGITIKYFEKSRTADERKAIETEIANEITNPAEKAARLEEISKKTYSDITSSGYFPDYNMIQFYNRNDNINLNNFYFDGSIIITGAMNVGKVADITDDTYIQDRALGINSNNEYVKYDVASKTWCNILPPNSIGNKQIWDGLSTVNSEVLTIDDIQIQFMTGSGNSSGIALASTSGDKAILGCCKVDKSTADEANSLLDTTLTSTLKVLADFNVTDSYEHRLIWFWAVNDEKRIMYYIELFKRNTQVRINIWKE